MKIAVIWARFGAYHLARLRGAAEFGSAHNCHIIGIEVAQQDHYAWEVCVGSKGFERITIFSKKQYSDLSATEISKGVIQALEQSKPDVVAINGWGVVEARVALRWCRKKGVGALLMSETKEDDSKNGRTWWKELAKGYLVRRFDAALVGGRKQAEYIQKLGFPPKNIFIGYDVIDTDYFLQQTKKIRTQAVALREQFQLPVLFFFACTRFLPRKNIDGLLLAYARYITKCQGVPWHLVIAGDGVERERLQTLQKKLNIQNILWPGFIQYNQLPIYFGLAAAFVHPAKAEPWGLVVNEAAASGLPLLISKTVGAAYELVEEGKNGLLFDPFNIEDIANALVTLSASSQDQRAALCAQSTLIAQQWTPRRFGEQLFNAASASI